MKWFLVRVLNLHGRRHRERIKRILRELEANGLEINL